VLDDPDTGNPAAYQPDLASSLNNRLFPDEGVAHVARRAGASVAG